MKPKTHWASKNEKPKRVKKAPMIYPFTLPDDLFRGWINPLTGIVPSILGGTIPVRSRNY